MEKEVKIKERYFYTTSTPHRWSSGPSVHYMNEQHEPIASLEEARQLAKKREHLTGSEDRVQVSWGVTYEEDVNYWGKPREDS